MSRSSVSHVCNVSRGVKLKFTMLNSPVDDILFSVSSRSSYLNICPLRNFIPRATTPVLNGGLRPLKYTVNLLRFTESAGTSVSDLLNVSPIRPIYHLRLAISGIPSPSWKRSCTFPGTISVSARYEAYDGW